jgi:acyl carrier protein phosphodiesterase
MNYLAHAYLAESSDEFLIGSIMGDFVKGPIDDLFNPQIANGVLFHRRVDAFADNHAMSRASRNLFSPRCRRYAGVILDICYDHFLSKNWSVYTDSDLSEFITRVYETLQRYHNILPASLQSVLPRMVQQDWLSCYRTLVGVDTTLGRIAQRINRENTLDESIGEIRKNYGQLERNFHVFFPDLIDFAKPFSA